MLGGYCKQIGAMAWSLHANKLAIISRSGVGDLCGTAFKNACVFYSSFQATSVAKLARSTMSPPHCG